MTPGLLRDALAVHAPDHDWPHDPAELLTAVEQVADSRAGEPVWTRLVLAAHDLATPPPALPGDLRARAIVRVDGFSSTWVAIDTEGETFLARCPRNDASPVHRRILDRDRRALAGHVPGLVMHDGVLVAPAPGTPLADAYIAGEDTVRMLGETFAALVDWRSAGIEPGAPARHEIRLVDGRLRLVVLTPQLAGSAGLLASVVATLPPLQDGPVAHFIEGLRTLDPDPDEAVALFRRALADELGQRAVDLRQRSLETGQQDRRARLQRAVGRLFLSLPPPSGSGPIGYDLEGRPTRVESDGSSVSWGHEPLESLFTGATFDAPIARRFLRACATAPTRPDPIGDPGVTEAMGRWVSAGLKLRTVRLLLEKS